MRVLKGIVVEPATHKNGKTSIGVKCHGVIHRIYASGEYHPYFRFQVGDSVLITIGSDNKPKIIENEVTTQVSEPLKKYLAEQATIYRAAYETAKLVMGDLVDSEDLRAIATSLYLQATKAGFFTAIEAGNTEFPAVDHLPPVPRPAPIRIGRRSME